MTDLIITLAIAILTAALIPTVINQFRAKASTMPLTTSIPSLVALTLLLVAYINQGWWFSTGITIINYALWGILVVQRWKYSPKMTDIVCSGCQNKFSTLGWQERDGPCNDHGYYCDDCIIVGKCGCITKDNLTPLRREDYPELVDIWDNKADEVYDDL